LVQTIIGSKSMGEKSLYVLYTHSLMTQGMSEAEAFKKANTEFFINQPIIAAVKGAAVGTMTSGSKLAYNLITPKIKAYLDRTNPMGMQEPAIAQGADAKPVDADGNNT
jgi:hypothetical protein